MAFQVYDAYGSVITIESSVVGGAQRQVIAGTLTTTPSGNQSVSGAVNIAGNPSISGTVQIGNTNLNIGGSVVSFPGAGWPGSVVAFQGGTYAPSAIGYLTRNDAVASFLGADLTFRPSSGDAAGRILIKPFAPEESRVEGYISLTSTSVTTLVAAAGAGLRNYITDIWAANTGAAATLITFTSGGGASVLGYTIAPAGGGSNIQGLTTPIRTLANEPFGVQAGTATSTLYVTVKGFKAP